MLKAGASTDTMPPESFSGASCLAMACRLWKVDAMRRWSLLSSRTGAGVRSRLYAMLPALFTMYSV
mgnify:CR=1 FL=1